MNINFISKLRILRSVVFNCRIYQFHKESTQNLSSTFKYSDLIIQPCNPEQKKSKPDDESLVFGKVFSDHMFEVEWTELHGWGKPVISPFHDLILHPAAKVLHYAQELFEGMKAFRGQNGKLFFFRPDLNMQRMLLTAERASLPKFDGEELLKCMKKLVAIDQQWIPEKEGCALYIRPTFIGIDPSLGVGSSKKALLYIITGPVGAYFQSGSENAVSLLANPSHVRAWPGGVGNRKMGCNYAPTIHIQQLAELQKLQQVLWLFGENHQLAEVGTMNIFVFLKNTSGVKPVSIETESLKYNDMGLIQCPVNGENKYPSDPLINIH
ncbi:branched-chain-amino-acid aminotransferase, cytosolic [Trichonephila clavipes]|nr:branched-chain-amino-acid aminotransferase, cytosolic [Trichonephila clavipes]